MVGIGVRIRGDLLVVLVSAFGGSVGKEVIVTVIVIRRAFEWELLIATLCCV